jgi:hypothetical protein
MRNAFVLKPINNSVFLLRVLRASVVNPNLNFPTTHMLTITVQSPIHDSFRVRQVAGMFDLHVGESCSQTFEAEVPALSEVWDIGVIVGPSGSGKTTLAKAAFGNALYQGADWPAGRAVIDCFGNLPIKQITRALTSVGFSSPPSWLKPYAVLSNGEKFRCELAAALLRAAGAAGVSGQGSGDSEMQGKGEEQVTKNQEPGTTLQRVCPSPPPLVFDEYSSVVDRTVAKIASAAIAKAIRSGVTKTRFVAVTCHYDVVRWLQPDWVLDMSGPSLSRGRIRRPPIALRIARVERSLWQMFKRHHYLTGSLHRAAQCFAGFIDDRPAVFTAVLPFPHPVRPGWREHRTVCLPDFQGIGIGAAMSEFIASVFVATGKPYFSTTSHPALIRHRAQSPLWKMHRKPGMVGRCGVTSRKTTGMSDTNSRGRNTAGFEYIGPARTADARKLGVQITPHAGAEWRGMRCFAG